MRHNWEQVVAKMKDTQKCHAGSKKQGVFVVTLDWLMECHKQGGRVDETPYLLYPYIECEAAEPLLMGAPNLLADLDAEMDAELDSSDDGDGEAEASRTQFFLFSFTTFPFICCSN